MRVAELLFCRFPTAAAYREMLLPQIPHIWSGLLSFRKSKSQRLLVILPRRRWLKSASLLLIPHFHFRHQLCGIGPLVEDGMTTQLKKRFPQDHDAIEYGK